MTASNDRDAADATPPMPETIWTVEAFTPITGRSVSYASFLDRESAEEYAEALRTDKTSRRRVEVAEEQWS